MNKAFAVVTAHSLPPAIRAMDGDIFDRSTPLPARTFHRVRVILTRLSFD